MCRRIGEYISLELFYLVNLTSSCSLDHGSKALVFLTVLCVSSYRWVELFYFVSLTSGCSLDHGSKALVFLTVLYVSSYRWVELFYFVNLTSSCSLIPTGFVAEVCHCLLSCLVPAGTVFEVCGSVKWLHFLFCALWYVILTCLCTGCLSYFLSLEGGRGVFFSCLFFCCCFFPFLYACLKINKKLTCFSRVGQRGVTIHTYPAIIAWKYRSVPDVFLRHYLKQAWCLKTWEGKHWRRNRNIVLMCENTNVSVHD